MNKREKIILDYYQNIFKKQKADIIPTLWKKSIFSNDEKIHKNISI